VLETIGIVLIVQGVGGLTNRLAESGPKDWLLQLHLLPDGRHVRASVATGIVGVVPGLRSMAGARRRTSTR
jgi:hypothetical protein